MSNKATTYIPKVYKGVLEMETIVSIDDNRLDNLDNEITNFTNNQFVSTANAIGIEIYENRYGIIADPTIESLEFRRERLQNRKALKLPYTLQFLRERLNELLGQDTWEIIVDYQTPALYIESSARDQSWLKELIITITKIKPANVVFINRPLNLESVLVGEEILTTEVTYNYKLGTTWLLGQKPFASYGLPEVIKMPTTLSVQASLLSDIADFTAEDITTVRLNGSLTVTDFNTKTASDNVVTLEYTVDNSLTNEITLVELLNSAGDVLTSSNVYVPVVAQVIMRHNITIKEGA